MMIKGGWLANLVTILVAPALAFSPVLAKSRSARIDLPEGLNKKLVNLQATKNQTHPSTLLQPTLQLEAFVLTENVIESQTTAQASASNSQTGVVIKEVIKEVKEVVTVPREVIKEVVNTVETVKEVKEIQTVVQPASEISASIVTSGSLDLARLPTIPYAKLSLTGLITNADIATDAKIHYSKLDLTGANIQTTINDSSVTDAKLASAYAQLGSGLARGDKIYSGSFSFDSSYASGGELVDLTGVFASSIKAVIVTSSKGGRIFEIDESLFASRQFKLKAVRSNNGNEENSGTNLSSITNVRYLAIGQ